MTLASEMQADITDMISDFPATFTYAGTSYACTCSPVTRAAQVEAEGVFQNFDLEITCVRFSGSKPTEQSIISVNDSGLGIVDIRYTVMEVIEDFGGLTFRCKRGSK